MTIKEKTMQNELEVLMKEFMDKNRNKYGNDSFSAGYLSSLVVHFAKTDKKLHKKLMAWFIYDKETYPNA
jgi:hypothetical protein